MEIGITGRKPIWNMINTILEQIKLWVTIVYRSEEEKATFLNNVKKNKCGKFLTILI
jgi:hypothetical protein